MDTTLSEKCVAELKRQNVLLTELSNKAKSVSGNFDAFDSVASEIEGAIKVVAIIAASMGEVDGKKAILAHAPEAARWIQMINDTKEMIRKRQLNSQ